MKVLLDTCVYGGGVEILEAAGYDVIWAGNWPRDPGDEETQFLETAQEAICLLHVSMTATGPP